MTPVLTLVPGWDQGQSNLGRDFIIKLLINLNGLIRTKNRIEQFKLACLKYGVEYKEPVKLV